MKQIGTYCYTNRLIALSIWYGVAQREEGRLKTEIQRLNNEITDLKEKMNTYEVCYIHSITLW